MDLSVAKQVLEKHYKQQLKKAIKSNDKDDMIWIKMKRKHSYQVLKVGMKILKKTPELKNLDRYFVKYAKIVFLLHDIGRFYEIGNNKPLKPKKYHHGLLGENILKQEKISDPLILLPIKHHNSLNLKDLKRELKTLKISKEEKQKILTLSKLIKDADKVANFLDFKKESVFALGEQDLNYSEQLLKSLKSGKLGDRNYKKTIFDSFLIYFSWEYDLFFEESKKILIKEKINKNLLKQFFSLVNKVAKTQAKLVSKDELNKKKEKMIRCGKEIEKVLRKKKLL